MFTSREIFAQDAADLIQHLAPTQPLEFWEAPPSLLAGLQEDDATDGDRTPTPGLRFLIFSYQGTESVILRDTDWNELVKCLETLENFQVAFGAGYLSPLRRTTARRFTHTLTFKKSHWVVLPLTVWQDLFQALQECHQPEEWQALVQGLQWLQADSDPEQDRLKSTGPQRSTEQP